MKRVSNYLRMRVLGALEYAQGDTKLARYKAVSEMTFTDEYGRTHQFSHKTIESWWYYYQLNGVTDHTGRSDKGSARKVTPEYVMEAIEQVMPSFHGRKHNVTEIYRTCIQLGLLQATLISIGTFRKTVKKFNLLKPVDHNSSKQRLAFAKPHANDLWQGDTLHGPYLDNGLRGKPIKTFLICFLDDASRVVPHGGFYAADDTPNLIDCFQTALYKRGIPKAVYVDNGSNYSSKELIVICARLGTVLIHTPVRDGAAKGKIERFFRTVRDQFLVRDLSHVNSLEQLNKEFSCWVEDTYHRREHSTLGMKPIDRFGLDLGRVRHLATNAFSDELFLLESTRKVRVDNTFSFNNTRYEAPRDLRNTTITIRHHREGIGFAPVVYQDGARLGEAVPLDFVANDRRPDIEF
ncbi:MAG: DDE-type integrase/transposase/recombinase [Verrucomicrobia bacterium]|nr:DDE-type integrase/transposase/recombinase [Verrucomicrobiota bacterium]